MSRFLKNLFLYGTTYTYSNLSRLFIRLFIGILFLRFGIEHIVKYDSLAMVFPEVWGMSAETSLSVMISIEIICSVLIMLGLLTRYACAPAILAMSVAIHRMLSFPPYANVSDLADLSAMDPVYLPIMFTGVFLYLLLAGPGKISLDYVLSLHLINKNQDFQDDDLLTEA